jgi:hypothetical protein
LRSSLDSRVGEVKEIAEERARLRLVLGLGFRVSGFRRLRRRGHGSGGAWALLDRQTKKL